MSSPKGPMHPAQFVEIRELARTMMTKEQLDGLADYLFGVPYISEIDREQADHVIAILLKKASPTRQRKARQMAEVMS